MTLFEIAVLIVLSLNVWVTYNMLRRLTVATLTGSFTVAHWLNPRRVQFPSAARVRDVLQIGFWEYCGCVVRVRLAQYLCGSHHS
jgi:hypothetical protein